MGRKILGIGFCGYVGSRLYQHLAQFNDIDTVDLELFGNYINKDNKKINYRELDKDFYSNYQVIVLLAGHSSVPMCKDDMIGTFTNNVSNFVDLLSKLDKQKLIFMSSSSVYGNIGEKKATEDWREYSPTNYYDLSKNEIDLYAKLSNIEYYGLRMGTVNGASPNLRVDIMINKMYYNAVRENKIEINNKTIYRPILGINDLCFAISSIINNKVDKRGIYNLASFNVQVGKIAETVSDCLDIPIIEGESTPSYNFSISTNKFEKAYDFRFCDTVESIVVDLHNNYHNCIPSTRNLCIKL